ncbi:MAG: ABC transporter ATP-binding protein/permease [Micavibrio sp.]|nr:ABC transporter ATP-binding protein/permease [Micavibrio sp.]
MAKRKTKDAAPPKGRTFSLILRLTKTYLAPYTAKLIGAILLMLLAAGMTGAVAQLIQPILDDVLGGQDTSMVVPVGVAVLVVFILRGLATYGHTLLMSYISQSVIGDVQRDLSNHFLTLDLGFFHANPSGALISRVVNDVQVMRVAITDSFTGFGKSIFTLIFLIAVMVYQDWKLSLASFTIMPFAVFFVARLGKRIRQVSGSIQSEMGNLSDRLGQTFQGIRQVQAYGMEEFEAERNTAAIMKVRKLNYKSVRIGNLSTPVNEILVGLVFFGIIVYGGYATSSGDMTAGELGAFLAAFTMAYEPMKKLAKLNYTVQMGVGASERVVEMLDRRSAIEVKDDAVELKTAQPEIEFKDVHFQYESTDAKALNGVSFKVPSGKSVALVGASGSGKSTAINLIPRFYDVQGGAVMVDSTDVRGLTPSSLRSHIALVSQDITIFDDTVEANIAYGRLGASRDEVIEAAKAAAAHDFIEGFSEGYETRVGEDGVKLSGGQRQRISIARAILRNAPILLLDEATSALDNESEKLVQAALERLEQGRTTVMIAHRLSTVQKADEILVLDGGRIVERGTHDALLAADGAYAKMHKAGEF